MSDWFNVIANLVTRSRDVVVTPQMDSDDRSKKATITTAEWVTNPMFGSPRRIDFAELEEYEDDITVQAALNYIVDSVATTEWDIIEDEDMVEEDEEVDNAEAVKFFNSKDWDESFDIVRRGIVADTLLYDCGVLVVTFPEYCYDEFKTLVKMDVAPLQLRARDGRSFIKQVDVHGDIMRYWQYSFLHTAAKPVEFDKAEIIYIQERPSTRSPYGTSKLEVVKNVADLMIAIQVGHRAEQENALQLGGIISHPDITDVEKLKRLSALYNTTAKGERNKGRWLVTGGSVDATPVNANVMDDSWIPGSDFYQQQILSIFKVPKTVLGFTSSDTNRATAIAQTTNFKRLGVSTMLTLLENIFTREIVKKYFNEKLCFRFVREVDLTDEAIRADIDAKNVSTGIRTVNELRMRDGLEEIEEPDIDPMTGLPVVQGGEEDDNVEGDDGDTAEEGVEKGMTRSWVPPTGKHIGYWRTVESAKDGDEAGKLKAKIGMFSDLGDSLKKELKTLVDKFTKIGITPEGKAKIESIKTRMDKAYSNRDDAIAAWEKHTGKKYTDKKPAAKKPGEKKPAGEKKERKPQSEEAKAKAAESKRLKGEINKYQAEGDALKSDISAAKKKYTSDGKMSAAGKKNVDALTEKMDAAYKQRDDAKKELDDVDAQIDPREGITGFSDDFISIYDTDMAIKEYMFGESSMTRSEYDVANKKFQTMLNSYGRDKYVEDSDKYQRIVDQRKKAAGIAIDPYNRTPVTDSAVFDLKDGKTDLGDMETSDVIKQLEAGGWNFERASFGFDEDSDFTRNTAVVENGVVCGVYDTVEHDASFELRTLQVNADMQRLGHGKKVMGHVIQDAIDSKKGKLTLHSLNSDSNKFYEAIGMKQTPGQSGGYEGDMTWMKEYLEALKNV